MTASVSKRFILLRKSLRMLQKHFLPAKFSSTGVYSAGAISKTRAYRLFAHAEFEHYFEERSLEVASCSFKKWELKRVASKTLLSLVLYSGRDMPLPPASLKSPQPSGQANHDELLDLMKRVKKAYSAFQNIVRNNNGIKEVDILRLLLPIGVDYKDLDPIWIATINSFGKARGEFAHTSMAMAINNPPDPKDEFTKVCYILDEVKRLDLVISSLKK